MSHFQSLATDSPSYRLPEFLCDARYEMEMRDYLQRVHVQPASGHPGQHRRHGPKNRGVPKKPLSAYNIFFMEEHARLRSDLGLRDLKDRAIVSEIGKRWKQLGAERRAALEARAEQLLWQEWDAAWKQEVPPS